jgi:trk system potassium uptake protein TrkH
MGFVEALFTATSAICVTGLVVKDLSTDFSLFGQLVVLVLIQIGGFGYMTVAAMPALWLGRKVGLKEQLVLREALNVFSFAGLAEFLRSLIKVTVLIEAIGALTLTVRFALDFPITQAIYLGVFHAISAFNNAGFSLFSTNLMDYRDDLVVNLVITTLIILGGIGFVVCSDVYRRARGESARLSLHSKLALTITAGLIMTGTAVFFVAEFQNPRTLESLSWPHRFLAAYFHAVSARTAGFNTIDLAQLSNVALYILMMLMFIGASPGGTGGGIKTTTFGTIVLDLWTSLRGQVEASLYRRRLPAATVAKSYLIAAWAFFWVTGATLVLLEIEHKDFLRLMFEVTSALGTVGLSTGDGGVLSFSALLSNTGKLVIALTMLAGRVGPLTLGIAVLKGQHQSKVRYPEGDVLIG